jgi:hypothetical protein
MKPSSPLSRALARVALNLPERPALAFLACLPFEVTAATVDVARERNQRSAVRP